MNTCIKRASAMLVSLLFLVSLCLNVTAAPYSTAANAGQRDEICTTLDETGADAYYEGDYTYDNLSQLSATDLLATLRTLLVTTHHTATTYAQCRDDVTRTDCQNGDGKIVLLYTSAVVTRSDFIGSGSIGWNREHVWPKSLGGFGNEGAGADLHHVRPDDVTTNAIRANLKYGNVDGGSDAKGSSLVGGASGGSYSSTYFEPHDNVKGDVARICLYVYVRYGGELAKCNNITNVFQSVDVLLEWCALDPVDTWEMGRNEVVAAMQGNRNVFIDYPEYAWLIFGKSVPADMITPSGMAQEGSGTPGDACSHGETELRDVVAASCEAQGYTGDTYCKLCGEMVASGTAVGPHAFSEWLDNGDGTSSRICTSCAYMETRTDTPASAQPDEGIWVFFASAGAVIVFCFGGVIGFMVIKRRRMRR